MNNVTILQSTYYKLMNKTSQDQLVNQQISADEYTQVMCMHGYIKIRVCLGLIIKILSSSYKIVQQKYRV